MSLADELLADLDEVGNEINEENELPVYGGTVLSLIVVLNNVCAFALVMPCVLI